MDCRGGSRTRSSGCRGKGLSPKLWSTRVLLVKSRPSSTSSCRIGRLARGSLDCSLHDGFELDPTSLHPVAQLPPSLGGWFASHAQFQHGKDEVGEPWQLSGMIHTDT